MLNNTGLFPDVDFGGFEAIDPYENNTLRGSRSTSLVTLSSSQIYFTKQLATELKIDTNGFRCAEVFINKEQAQVMIVLTKQQLSDKALALKGTNHDKYGASISSKGIMRAINQIQFMDLEHFIYSFRPTHVDTDRGQIIIDLSKPLSRRAPRKHSRKSGADYAN